MPVTAKLSRKFYDQFGDDIANELVDWFNKVDDTYRAELRELNELNYARFDAKLEQRLAEFGASLRAEMAKMEKGLRAEMAEQNSSLRADMAKMETQLHRLVAETKSDLMRWIFGLWATQMLALVGAMLALLSRLP